MKITAIALEEQIISNSRTLPDRSAKDDRGRKKPIARAPTEPPLANAGGLGIGAEHEEGNPRATLNNQSPLQQAASA